MHIELTEMLRCPVPHQDEFLVLSTGEMSGRMVLSGVVGCPVCHREYEIVNGVVDFRGRGTGHEGRVSGSGSTRPPSLAPRPVEAQTLQALLDLSGPGGFVVLLGAATRHAVGLAALMGGIHFIGVNPPADAEELPILSLLKTDTGIPLRQAMARGVVVGLDAAMAPWLAEAHRVLLRGRRYVLEHDAVALPEGVTRLAAAEGLVVGEKR